MRETIAFCLIGFTGSEASALQALIRLMVRRGQSCSLVREIAGADMVVANADDPETMRILWAQPVTARVLLIGADDGATGWTLLPRPMKLLAVLDTIDSLLSAPPSRRAELEPTPPAPVAAGFEPTRPYSLGDSRHGGLDSRAGGFPATQPFDPRTVQIAPSTLARIRAVPAPRQEDDIDAASIASWRRQQQARREGPTSAYADFGPDATDAADDSAIDSDFPDDRVDAAALPRGGRPIASSGPLPPAPLSDFYIGSNDPHVATPPPSAYTAEALVIDAGEMSRRTLQNRLHRHGLRTDAVGSGEEALKQVSRRTYRYVFIDELTGSMAANDVARALRKLQPSGAAKLSIVLLSSRGGAFEKFRARLAGVDTYLVKPVSDDDFARAVGSRRD